MRLMRGLVLGLTLQFGVSWGLATTGMAAERYLAKPGMYVTDMARREYGSSHFAKVIEKHNHIKSGELQPGTLIKTPPLTDILQENGFPKALRHVVARIEKGYDYWRDAEKALRKSKPGGQTKYKPAPRVAADLNRAISLIRQGRNLVEQKAKPSKPTDMIEALDKAIGVLDQMVRGRFAADGSDFGHVYRYMADAYVEGIEWGHRHYAKRPNDTWNK